MAENKRAAARLERRAHEAHLLCPIETAEQHIQAARTRALNFIGRVKDTSAACLDHCNLSRHFGCRSCAIGWSART